MVLAVSSDGRRESGRLRFLLIAYFNGFVHIEEGFYTRNVSDLFLTTDNFLSFYIILPGSVFILRCHASPTKKFWLLTPTV